VKRRDLIRELRRLAGEFGVEFELVRHGAEHDQFHEDRAWKEE
jgi:alpha-L-fucosidase